MPLRGKGGGEWGEREGGNGEGGEGGRAEGGRGRPEANPSIPSTPNRPFSDQKRQESTVCTLGAL